MTDTPEGGVMRYGCVPRRGNREVRCADCKTVYLVPLKQKRLKSYECCPNEDCNGRRFRTVKRRG